MSFLWRLPALPQAVRSYLSGGDDGDSKSWAPAVLSLCVLGLGLYTAVATALIAHRTYSPVILWDQWAYVDQAIHSHGWPSWSQLWVETGDCRLVTGRLAGFLDLQYFGGRNISLAILLYLFPLCVALVLIWMILRSGQLRGAPLVAATGFIAFCALSPLPIDDFTWYHQVGYVLADLAAVISLACAILHSFKVQAGDRRWISVPLVFSLFAAFVAGCSYIHGLLAWPILLVLSFSLRFPKQTRMLIGGLGIAAIATYFWGFEPSGGASPSPVEWIRHPIDVTMYVLRYFGTTWDSFLSPRSTGFVLSDALTIMAIGIAITAIVRHLVLQRPVPDHLRTFLSAVMLLTLLAALMTCIGRLKHGTAEAAVNRYQCVALLFWAAVATLILTWAAGRPRRNSILTGLQAGLLVLMAAGVGRFDSFEQIAASRKVRIGRAYVAITRDPANAAAANILSPKAALMPVWCAYLRGHGLGPDLHKLEAGLPRVPGPAPIPNWAGYKVVAADRCLGYFDGLEPGVQVPGVVAAVGWAWDREAHKPPRKIVLARRDGWVVGFGELLIPREDFFSVEKDVTNVNTGWEGEASAVPGDRLRAYALLDDATSICPLPNEVMAPRPRGSGKPGTAIGAVDGAGDSKGSDTIFAPGILYVWGWAADSGQGAPVDRVIVYVDGTLAGVATLGVERPDVEQHYGRADYSTSGWNFGMLTSKLTLGKHTVTAMASGPGKAAQLESSRTITIRAGTDK